MTNIKPDNGMDPAVEGLEAVAECLHSKSRGYHQMTKPDKLGIDASDKAFGFSVVKLVTHQSAQAAVQAAYQRGVLDERKRGDAAVAQLEGEMADQGPYINKLRYRITQLEATLVVARRELAFLAEDHTDSPALRAIAAIDSLGVTKT